MANFTTLADVKAFAGVTGSGDDSAINGIIAAVSLYLASVVGHDFNGTPIVGELHEAPAATPFVILNKPVATVSAVREGGQTLASTSWRLIPGTRIVERRQGSASTLWAAEASVDYTPTSTVPADVELAAREASAWVLKESALPTGGSRIGLTAQANADSGNSAYFIKRIEDLPIVRAIAKRYGRFA